MVIVGGGFAGLGWVRKSFPIAPWAALQGAVLYSFDRPGKV